MSIYNASVRNLIDADTSKMLDGWEAGSSVSIPSGSTSPSPLLTKCLLLEGKSGSPETLALMSAQKRLEKNHRYYIRYYEYHTANEKWSTDIYWPVVDNGQAFSASLGSPNKWNMLSAVFIRNSWDSDDYDFRLDFNNLNVAGKAYFTGLMLIDLTTSFGAGSEKSKDWCDTNLPYFIDGYDMKIDKFEIGDTIICNYSGKTVPVKLPSGDYRLECWGAQGGTSKDKDGNTFATPANGGYSIGKLHLDQETTVYMVCGEAGNNDWKGALKRTFNGGGRGGFCGTKKGYDVTVFPSGGGATHIATADGQLSSLSSKKDSVLIVAGGGAQKGAESGGESHEDFQALNAFGGGETAGKVGYRAQKRKASDIKYLQDSAAGNQSAGGQGAKVQLDALKVRTGSTGSFGQGGDGSNSGTGNAYGPGGGGGYYGGGGGAATWELRLLYIYNVAIGASGGSGYVNPILTDAHTYTEEQKGYNQNPDPSGNGYIKITMLSKPEIVHVYYKDEELFTFEKDYYESVPVRYNGRTIFNITHGRKIIMCSINQMRSDLEIGPKTLLCEGLIMKSNVEILVTST